MALYERIMGLEEPKISPHVFLPVLAEFHRGRITQSQAESILGLSASEKIEAQTLLATFSGTIQAKLVRAIEVEDVLILAEKLVDPYDTPTKIKLRLGV